MANTPKPIRKEAKALGKVSRSGVQGAVVATSANKKSLDKRVAKLASKKKK